MKLAIKISPAYKRPALHGAVICVLLMVFSFMFLDTGQMGMMAIYASAAFWAGVVLIVLRRPQSPTHADLEFVRFGYLLAYLLAQLLAPWIWHLRGATL